MSTACKFVALALLAGSVAWVAPAIGQEPAASGKRKIVVTGSATVSVKPDKARITFVVTTTDEDAKKVRDEDTKQVKKVKDALTALNLKNVDIQVVPSGIGSTTSGFGQGLGGGIPAGGFGGPAVPAPAIEKKQTQTTFYVTVRDKNEDNLRLAVTKLADVATENGGTGPENATIGYPTIYGATTKTGPKVEWCSESAGEARKEAIKKAVAEALANAQAAVGDAKVSVVEIQVVAGDTPVTWTDKPTFGLCGVGYPLIGNSTSESTPPITVHVQVTCSY